MFSNYLKIAWRCLWRYKTISVINIIGLAIGFACAALILLYVRHEFSFDQYHTNKDQIYRLATSREGAAYSGIAKVPGPWGLLARSDLPDVENVTRFVLSNSILISRGASRAYEPGGVYADSSLFEVFSFPLISGDPHTALRSPNSVILTESIAKKYFGDEPALGQSLTFDNTNEYVVTGILQDVPLNSHFTFNYVISMASYGNPRHDDWRWNQYYTYLLLSEDSSPAAFPEKFLAVLKNHRGEEAVDGTGPFLQPLTDIHLHSNLFREISTNSDVAYIYIFSAVAFFILLIACINFMNLSTARAATRSKEVGIRKVSGAFRSQLIKQFLGEALITSAVAFVLSLILIELLLPVFNELAGRQLAFELFDRQTLVTFLALAIFVGLLAGSYPAFVLSAFKPAESLKGNTPGSSGAWLRKALVVSQFIITAILMISTGVVYTQIQYIQDKRLGFNPEQLITFRIRSDDMRSQYEVVKQTLLQNPNILNVSVSGNLPGGGDWGIPYRAEGVAADQQPPMRMLVVDYDFIETFGMEIVRGRGFSEEYATDASGAFIINEEAVRQFGWEDPLGQRLGLPAIERDFAPVVGVLKDFHFRSMREEIGPIMFFIPSPDWFSIFTVRVRSENIGETMAFLESTWQQFDPDHPFTSSFFDQRFASLHASESQMAQLLGYVAILAIVIACLGLFGLVAFTAEQRTKEIGIRRVLGATELSIVTLLSSDFIKLVLLANIFAWPAAWFLMQGWLENFAYRTEISFWVFLWVGLGTATIALMTVSTQAIKAALANPVQSLRYGTQ